jgi:hypothetical protein
VNVKREADYLQTAISKEADFGLYRFKVDGIPIWRLVRTPVLRRWLRVNCGLSNSDKRVGRRKVGLIEALNLAKFSLLSLADMLALFRSGSKHRNLFIAFPRLQEWDGEFFDRFTDPLISSSDASGDFIVFQRRHGSQHYHPRRNADKVYRTDFLDILSGLLSFLIFPFLLLHIRSVKNMHSTARRAFPLNTSDILNFYFQIVNYKARKLLFKYILKSLGVRQVFLVNRCIHYAEVTACKELGVSVYEVQHGVTQSHTVLYSGRYCEQLDVDAFLSFSSFWEAKWFGLPEERMLNVGFAHKSEISRLTTIQNKENTVLFVSEWLSDIVCALYEFLLSRPHQSFHIRPHPNDSLPSLALRRIKDLDNVEVIANSSESMASLRGYTHVIGVSSSMLFEAHSLGKPVAVLNFSPFRTNISKEEFGSAFTFLNSVQELASFLESTVVTLSNNIYYEDFNKPLFNGLLR